MDPTTAIAWVSAGSGLVGALIGAGSALGGKWVDAHHARKAEKRREANDLLARFWEAADRYWRTSKSLRDIVEDLQASRQAGHPTDDLNVSRERAIAEMNSAQLDARFLLAKMRLNGWPIARTAESLLVASQFKVLVDPASVHRMHTAALRAFEKEARAMTGAKDPDRQDRRLFPRTRRAWQRISFDYLLWALSRLNRTSGRSGEQ
ncbi:hypothetical protein [Nocardioides luteus]|uniref:hypothetical protein n=1 Tax=Nocardioides luteus TaxID=1844 RepID=UPI0018CA13B7|nr:hypothetical protein [Nocardioides luteus]MBG6095959.1 hypothetical protein [Nocardioides luteus]